MGGRDSRDRDSMRQEKRGWGRRQVQINSKANGKLCERKIPLISRVNIILKRCFNSQPLKHKAYMEMREIAVVV